MKVTLLLMLSLLFVSQSEASFFPPNNLSIPVGAKGGLTEAQFNTIIDKAETVYGPIIAQHGFKFKVERLWKNSAVNAEAEQIAGDWVVRMFGGMARYRDMTEEAFTLVLCHEIGHHIGGAPRYVSDLPWATNEGQADYFASLKCTRRLWSDVDNSARISALKVPALLSTKCLSEWTGPQERAVCVRAGMGGLTIGNMLAFMRRYPAPRIERTDQGEVTETEDRHGSPQCRVDSFINGALCEKAFTEDVSFDSEVTGACHGLTGQTVGLRPRCWFKPKL